MKNRWVICGHFQVVFAFSSGPRSSLRSKYMYQVRCIWVSFSNFESYAPSFSRLWVKQVPIVVRVILFSVWRLFHIWRLKPISFRCKASDVFRLSVLIENLTSCASSMKQESCDTNSSEHARCKQKHITVVELKLNFCPPPALLICSASSQNHPQRRQDKIGLMSEAENKWSLWKYS